MNLRDEIESLIRSWDTYEIGQGGPPVVDFDCYPDGERSTAADSRIAVYREISSLRRRATESGNDLLAQRLDADRAYLGGLLGMRLPLGDYIGATQGCGAAGWPGEYVDERGGAARKCVEALGISWGPGLLADMGQLGGPVDVSDAADAIREAASGYESAVREATGTDAPYELAIETTRVDAYWAYWLDGSGQQVRLRLNVRNARFDRAECRQFALHEILGHGLQSASFAARCAASDVPWVRLMSVHAPQQVLLEGLAQAMPLFITPDDELLVARVRVDHYTQLVRAGLHLGLNSGSSIEECVAMAKARVPWWSDGQIGAILADRGGNPQLRSYLWAYPAGIDWFASLAEADTGTIHKILRAAYRDPLTPGELTALWPDGPAIGGPGCH